MHRFFSAGSRLLKVSALFLCLALLLMGVSCAGEGEAEDAAITLTVLKETDHGYTQEGSYFHVIQQTAAYYNKSHPLVNIEIQSLPEPGEERDIVLEKLRVEIMSGKGPDIFLLPVEHQLDPETVPGAAEPLFQDVGHALRDLLFADLSPYYDADKELRKEELCAAVMDAGVVEGGRYLLPLSYTLPVLVAEEKTLEQYGLDGSALATVDALYDAALQRNDPALAAGVLSPLNEEWLYFSAFPKLYDYEKGQVLLEKEDLKGFLRKSQKLKALAGQAVAIDDRMVLSDEYLWSTESWFNEKTPLYCSNLGEAAARILAVSKAEGKRELTVIPLRASDGKLTANITFFGAVGAGCPHPKEAYEFLRLFLLPEVQHNGYSRPEPPRFEAKGLFHNGGERKWPVRTKGALQAYADELAARRAEFPGLTMRDGELESVRQEEIGEVRFETAMDQKLLDTVQGLNEWGTGKAVETDFDSLSEKIIEGLRWQVQE